MEKKKYIPPTIDVIDIELENCLAAGSNIVRPVKSNNFITDEYEQGEEQFDEIW